MKDRAEATDDDLQYLDVEMEDDAMDDVRSSKSVEHKINYFRQKEAEAKMSSSTIHSVARRGAPPARAPRSEASSSTLASSVINRGSK